MTSPEQGGLASSGLLQPGLAWMYHLTLQPEAVLDVVVLFRFGSKTVQTAPPSFPPKTPQSGGGAYMGGAYFHFDAAHRELLVNGEPLVSATSSVVLVHEGAHGVSIAGTERIELLLGDVRPIPDNPDQILQTCATIDHRLREFFRNTESAVIRAFLRN
jgi:hypothetical protein